MKLTSLLKAIISRVLHEMNYSLINLNKSAQHEYPIEATEFEKHIIELTSNFTMTGKIRQWSLVSSINYLNNSKIEGDLVEVGVWKGGNLILMELMTRRSEIQRGVIGFDTFNGMNSPTSFDIESKGIFASDLLMNSIKDPNVDNIHCIVNKSNVLANLTNTLGVNSVKLVEGEVEKTLLVANNIPKRIALLRLDTDWYESTKIELQVLYPRLVTGGVLIIDDYGAFSGCKKAVDEYFPLKDFLFFAVDNECRIFIKMQ